MPRGASASFGAQLKALREEAGFTQEELATIAGLSVHAISALERGERRRPHVETVRAASSLPPAAELRALVGAATMWYLQGEFSSARAALNRAQQIATTSGDTEMLMHTELIFGHVEHADGQLPAARERFSRSVDGFRTLGISWGCANSLSAMALIALAAGDVADAQRCLDEAAPALQVAGPWFSSLARYVHVVLAIRRGRPDEVIALVRGTLVDIRHLQDRFVFVNILVPLAAAAALKGDYAWTARIVGTCDAIAERSGIASVYSYAQDLREEAERSARTHLTADQWQRAYVAGRTTSIDSMIHDIDRAIATH